MIRHLFCIAITLLFLQLNAQSYEYTFSYDGSGNRISRTVITLEDPDKVSEEEAGSEAYQNANGITDLIAEQNIRLYPNPAEQHVILEITELESSLQGEISIYALNGTRIIHRTNIESINRIDLHALQSGNYIVKVQIADITKEYQLIKL